MFVDGPSTVLISDILNKVVKVLPAIIVINLFFLEEHAPRPLGDGGALSKH